MNDLCACEIHIITIFSELIKALLLWKLWKIVNKHLWEQVNLINLQTKLYCDSIIYIYIHI